MLIGDTIRLPSATMFSLEKSHQSELQRIVSPATKHLNLKRKLVPQ
jgi:hypothetical protein